MFSYISAERRASKENPLRAIREMADAGVGSRFDAICAKWVFPRSRRIRLTIDH
jgi:hypothetical protein